MRDIAHAVVFCVIFASSSWAQSSPPSVASIWVADYSPAGVRAAVSAGKNTLIYSGGSSLAVASHVEVAKYVARRVAEELADALVLPIVPDSSGADERADRDITGAVAAASFTSVVVIADEGAGPTDATLETLARRLSNELKGRGIHVYFVTAHEMRPGHAMTFNADYLRRWAGRSVMPDRRKPIEDAAELLFVDPDHHWLNPDAIAAEDRAFVNPSLGRILLEERVSSILNQIRLLSPDHLRPPSSSRNPQNRLSAIPGDKMTQPLMDALAQYKAVRPDGIVDRNGAVGAGGPSLWSVYVHLPEILGPLRELHEQAHVNPRISQKLVHFIIMITARYWTNDIWTAHEEDSIREGLGRDTVKALAEGRHPDHMAEDEEIIYDFCTELLENKRVSDATYARAVATFGEEGVVQATVIEGLYTYMSMAVNMAYPESANHGRLAPFPQ
jgi:4-carboxymuconolactone decarboxylase